MSEFGWTRLAYLSVILTVLAVLVKLGTLGASSLTENFPQSALTFAQRTPIFEEHLDWERHAADDSEATRADEHSDDEHSDDERVEGGDPGHSREPVESIYENVNFEEDPPVFYRPAPRVSSASENPSEAAESCQTVGDAPPGSEILFPMTREHFDSYDDTWGAARPQGGHEGTDLMVPNGTPLLAMTDGRIVPVAGANGNGWNTLGGYTVMLEAAYSVGPVKEGDLFYYAHMDGRGEFQIGDTVEAGDVLGFAGDTGQGPEGARGQFPSHLHLGWYETSGERTQLASGAMNPYPLLEWVKANGGSIAGGSDIPYCEAPQPPTPAPSGGGYWQFPSDPGVRPDMSTETGTAAPSPIIEQNDSAESSPDITREPRQPVTPRTPANSAPPKETPVPPETTAPRPSPDETPPNGTPPNGMPTPPSIPNPLPGLGDGIRDAIDGILDPAPPEPTDENEPTEPTTPAASPEDTAEPGEPPAENTTLEETNHEETNHEETSVEGALPEDEATDEEDDECEPREPGDEESGDEESGEEPHERDEEDCSEETSPDPDDERPPDEEATGGDVTNEEEPAEETTGPPSFPSSETVEEQYGAEQSNPEAGTPEPETTSGP